MQYRRLLHSGGRYFFTLVTAQRRAIFTDDETIKILRHAFLQVMNKHPFSIDAFVLLPDHLHCIWTLPENDDNFAMRWRLIKTWFTKHYQPTPPHHQSPWQNRYWEHLLRNDLDYQHHVEYIHYNPVKHGYVQSPCEWVHSSFQRYVKKGIYPEDWGSSEVLLPRNIGGE